MQIYPLKDLPGSKVLGGVSCASVSFCVALEVALPEPARLGLTGTHAFVYNGSGWLAPRTIDK
jgi:hypothetical protein